MPVAVDSHLLCMGTACPLYHNMCFWAPDPRGTAVQGPHAGATCARMISDQQAVSCQGSKGSLLLSMYAEMQDVEGYEPAVMSTAIQLLNTGAIDNLIMEYTPGVLERAARCVCVCVAMHTSRIFSRCLRCNRLLGCSTAVTLVSNSQPSSRCTHMVNATAPCSGAFMSDVAMPK
jgi:hypothetical protein